KRLFLSQPLVLLLSDHGVCLARIHGNIPCVNLGHRQPAQLRLKERIRAPALHAILDSQEFLPAQRRDRVVDDLFALHQWIVRRKRGRRRSPRNESELPTCHLPSLIYGPLPSAVESSNRSHAPSPMCSRASSCPWDFLPPPPSNYRDANTASPHAAHRRE